MKQIPLTQGQFALVDNEDYDFLNQFKWYANRCKNTFYAERSEIIAKHTKKTIIMHRLIMNPSDEMEIDHIDHNGLNNQKANLRVVTSSQNNMNQQPRRNISSIFKGVYWKKQVNRWVASIGYNQKVIHLGYFEKEIDGAIAYNKKAVELFGQYAWLNPIPDEYKNRTPVRRKKAKPEFSSPYNGVTWDKSNKKWRARITKNKKRYFLGYFLDEEAAHQAYLKAKNNFLHTI